MPDAHNPNTAEKWQEIVNMAEFLLLLHSAREFGLITITTVIDPKRCCEILALGATLGFKPDSRPELIKQFLVPA
jgi:hypothetical protein